MLRRRSRAVWVGGLIAVAVAAGLVPSGASAERYRRDFTWQGYRWQVRLAQHENPDHNNWGDSRSNVRVQANGVLRLAITGKGAQRRSVEVVTKRQLGYGRYRWVIASSLGELDLYSVVALFTHETVHKPPYGEQIFEFSRWADPFGLPGWAVTWSVRTKAFDSFPLSAAPPYVAEITFRRGAVRLYLRDATGAVLYDRTWPTKTKGDWMHARMSYWMYHGAPDDLVPPPVLLRSFHFTPLSKLR